MQMAMCRNIEIANGQVGHVGRLSGLRSPEARFSTISNDMVKPLADGIGRVSVGEGDVLPGMISRRTG
jgi:hypothetical protein